MQILVAEDDFVSRKILAQAVSRLGHDVRVAASGDEAWKLYSEEGADLLLTDWSMPGMDGPELCRRVREHPSPRHAYTYVVFLTVHGESSYFVAAMKGGADDFVPKPLNVDQVEACLVAAERVTSLHGRLRSQADELEQRNLQLARQARALQQSEAAMRAFYDSTGLSMGVVELFDDEDDDLLHISANANTAVMYGVATEDMIDRRATSLGSPPDRIRNLVRHYRRAQELGAPVYFEYERELWGAGPGGSQWMLATLAPIGRTEEGRHRFSYVIQDITGRKRHEQELQGLNAKLEALAAKDGLTGLANRRAYEENLTRAIDQARRYSTPLSLLILDVDRFKQYNDTYGHPAGDVILQSVGRLLAGTARATDFVARYGGEEFVVVLGGTDRHGAKAMAERFRAEVESFVWPQRAITISVGAATLDPSMADGEALTEAADQALYHSKRAGRNRVTHVQDAGVAPVSVATASPACDGLRAEPVG